MTIYRCVPHPSPGYVPAQAELGVVRMTIAFDKSCNASAAIFGGASGTSFPSGPTWSGSTSASATYAIMVLGFSANPGTITATGWTVRTTFNDGANCYVVTLEIVGSGAAGR